MYYMHVHFMFVIPQTFFVHILYVWSQNALNICFPSLELWVYSLYILDFKVI
jgi:hypothetical protein